jgi:Gas vesicle protein G
MGPVKALLTLPLAPVTGLRWVTGVLAQEAERELQARQSPERALADLDAKRATGEISEEDAAALESQLLEQMLSQRGLSGGA